MHVSAVGFRRDAAAVDAAVAVEEVLRHAAILTAYAGGGKGNLTLKFASLDQLDMICQRLSGEAI